MIMNWRGPEVNHDIGNNFASVDINDFEREQELNTLDTLLHVITDELIWGIYTQTSISCCLMPPHKQWQFVQQNGQVVISVFTLQEKETLL